MSTVKLLILVHAPQFFELKILEIFTSALLMCTFKMNAPQSDGAC